MTTIVRRNCWRLLLVVGLWVAVFSINEVPVAAQPPATCGDNICQGGPGGENTSNCCVDCCAAYCGDAICEPNEESWCQQDCGFCGDGYCHPFETQYCYQDCEPICGDGYCDWREDSNSCPWDCPPDYNCGNFACEPGEEGWCFWDCPECGDSICHWTEQQWCYYDCAP
jgi:hypothetical protein